MKIPSSGKGCGVMGTGQPSSRVQSWGQFVKAALGISKLLSFFYKQTHGFSKLFFFSFGLAKWHEDDKAARDKTMRAKPFVCLHKSLVHSVFF